MNVYYVIFKDILDILIAAFLIYQLVKYFIKSEKMIFVINAILMLFLLYIFSLMLQLNVVSTLLSNVFSWGILLIFILFQTEIRNSLEKLGSTTRRGKSITNQESFVEDFTDTVFALGKEKIGALITFEMEMPMTEYTEKAIKLDAKYSSHLIISIFQKDSPLHDGAVIIKDRRITHASTYYPIGLDFNIDKKYGTRHRSGLTISAETDSITVIVSEETGNVSIAYKENLYTDLERDFVVEYLNNKLK